MKKESFSTGVLFMLLSSAGLAFTGFFAETAFRSITLPALMLGRFAFSLLIAILFLWVRGELHGLFPIPSLKMHLLRAFFMICSQYSFYYYIEKSTLLNAMVLLNLGPLIIPLIEWGIMKHRVGLSTWIGMLVSFVGVMCILQPDAGILSLVSLIGLTAGISQGASQVVFGINSRTERGDLGVLYLFSIGTAFALIPYLCAPSIWLPGIAPSLWILLLFLLLAIASNCNQLARAIAYQHSTPSRLSSFLYSSILLAGFLDWLVYDKVPNTLSLIGAGLVILGGLLKIYLRTLRSSTK